MDVHLMEKDGAWSDDGTAWYADAHYPTARLAREQYASFTGVPVDQVEATQVYVRHASEHGRAGEYDGEYWEQCESDAPGAFLAWRVE